MMMGYPMYDTLFVITWPSVWGDPVCLQGVETGPWGAVEGGLVGHGILGV